MAQQAALAICVAMSFLFFFNAADADDRFVGENSQITAMGPPCNATAYTQVPGHPDLFLGRQMILAPDSNKCDGRQWTLTFDHFDWKSHTFTLIRTLMNLPAEIGDGRGRDGKVKLTSAYDPYIAEFNGQYWVTFECAGLGFRGTSTCIAPFRIEDGTVDLARCYIIIAGNQPQKGEGYVASDPKLLVHQGHLYLYWTAISMQDGKWVSISTRGTELLPETSGQRLWPASIMGKASEAVDPHVNVVVWKDADVFSVLEKNGNIYATAGYAGEGCLKPSDNIPNCFRVLISRANSPLGDNVFGKAVALDERLPKNPQEYARLVEDPTHNLFILDHVLAPHPSDPKGNFLSVHGSALLLYPVDLESLFGK